MRIESDEYGDQLTFTTDYREDPLINISFRKPEGLAPSITIMSKELMGNARDGSSGRISEEAIKATGANLNSGYYKVPPDKAAALLKAAGLGRLANLIMPHLGYKPDLIVDAVHMSPKNAELSISFKDIEEIPSRAKLETIKSYVDADFRSYNKQKENPEALRWAFNQLQGELNTPNPRGEPKYDVSSHKVYLPSGYSRFPSGMVSVLANKPDRTLVKVEIFNLIYQQGDGTPDEARGKKRDYEKMKLSETYASEILAHLKDKKLSANRCAMGGGTFTEAAIESYDSYDQYLGYAGGMIEVAAPMEAVVKALSSELSGKAGSNILPKQTIERYNEAGSPEFDEPAEINPRFAGGYAATVPKPEKTGRGTTETPAKGRR